MRTLIFCVASFVAGFAALYFILFFYAKKHPARKRRNQNPDKPKKSLIDRIGTMNLILIIVASLLIAFTIKMINLYETTGAIPDTLVTCVFSLGGGECGIMGWIKTAKERRRDRKWEIEDRKEADAAGNPPPNEPPQ